MPAIHFGTIDRIVASARTLGGEAGCPLFSTVTLTLTDGTGDLEIGFFSDPEIGSELADAINAVFAEHAAKSEIGRAA